MFKTSSQGRENENSSVLFPLYLFPLYLFPLDLFPLYLFPRYLFAFPLPSEKREHSR